MFVHGDRLIYTRADRWRINGYDLNGERIGSARGAWDRREVSASAIADYQNAWLRTADNPNDRRRIQQEIDEAQFAEYFPAISGVLVDGNGFIWVENYDSRIWTLFNGDFERLGTVRMPANLEVFEIGADFVLGVHQDSLGLEHVRLYELHKP